MSTDLDLDLDLVRELRAEPTAPAAAARESGRAALTACIEAERAGAAGAASPPRAGGRRRLLVPSLGVAMLAGAAALALVLLLGNGGAARPDPAAAAVLERVARVAGAAGGPRALRAGEYWYVRSRDAYSSTSVYSSDNSWTSVTPELREIWTGRDGGGRVRSHLTGRTRFASPHDRAEWVRAGRPNGDGGHDLPLRNDDEPLGAEARNVPFGSEALTYGEMLALPTDAGALTKRVRKAAGTAGPSPREEMFTIVGDVLRESPAPPALRAALYRVTARIPGIELVGQTRDGLGRPALAVALTAQGTRHELLFDPRTSRLLEERDVVVSDPPGSKLHLKPGFVEGETTYGDSGIVARVGERP